MSTSKRRLKLAPEVLPDPRLSTRDGAPRATVRSRTKLHMQHLLAAAAATSAMACSKCNNSGYGVVDPMPAPARCPGLSSGMTVVAAWRVAADGGAPVVVVDVEVGLAKPGTQFTAGAPASTFQGTVTASKSTATHAHVEVEPRAYAAPIMISIPAECPPGTTPGSPASIQVTVILDKAPVDGQPLTATLRDDS